MTITIDLKWVKDSHPRDVVREIAEVMLVDDGDPVAQAERLGDFLERDREVRECWHEDL